MLEHTYIFPGQSPRQLKADPFLDAKVLHKVPDWIINEADRWPDPWSFLLGVRALPSTCYALFRAAASVSRAMRRVLYMSWGGATLQRNVADAIGEQQKNGNTKEASRLAVKLTRQMLKHGLWSESDHGGISASYVGQLDAWKAEVEQTLLKSHHWKPSQTQQVRAADDCSPTAGFLIANWLRWGRHGEPGLCYYSDKALSMMMILVSGQKFHPYAVDVKRPYYRKLRQRLGLQQAYYRRPLVTSARPVRDKPLIEIEVNFHEGTVRHVLSDGQKLVIGGKQFYPLPV